MNAGFVINMIFAIDRCIQNKLGLQLGFVLVWNLHFDKTHIAFFGGGALCTSRPLKKK